MVGWVEAEWLSSGGGWLGGWVGRGDERLGLVVMSERSIDRQAGLVVVVAVVVVAVLSRVDFP